ncbi:hypothetical protein [Glutamicibacter nicotianae]|uniref:hypothetical protein n=1 Tax=Glutamicibacter nicotianae TaxID=37929 RepID=UPI00167F4F94|nr:hypothetical protein [Glutamicibacter nicotianae]
MDSRFPTYYLQDRRVLKASPTAFRLFVIGSAWSVSNMTDGLIPTDDFALIPLAQTHDAEALVSLGLWAKVDAGWQIVDFLKIQTSASQFENALLQRRANEAKRQREKRAKDKAALEEAQKALALEEPGELPTVGTVSRDCHVTSERQRKGKAEAEEEARTMNLTSQENLNKETGELEDMNPWKNLPLKDESQESDSGPNLMDQFMNTKFGGAS